MSVRVLLPNAFLKHTNGTREIQSTAGNLPQLITEIETTFPDLRSHLRDEQGQVRRFINFYVNEEDIRFLGNDQYAFKDGDEVLVIPSIAGGSWPDGSSAQVDFCTQGGSASRSPRVNRDGLCSCCSYCGQEPCLCGD